MASIARKISLLGATGALGSHIAGALKAAGHDVTAVQRKDSTKPAPEGLKSVKVDYQNKEELISTFTGQDVVISAVPFPTLDSEKTIIDACIAASVKRFMPSEYTTMLESPFAINLPIAKEKVLVRQYLSSVITSASSPTTWTSVNTGAFLDMALKYGVLGPNPMSKKAIFHDGGDKVIAVSLLSDIATAIVKLLETDSKFEAAANQPVYVCSAAVTERRLTKIVSEVTGIDFGTPEQVSVKELIEASDERLKNGDQSAIINYYFQMMYGEGYKGGDFMKFNWNERLGLRIMSEQELKSAIQQILGN
ncbi:NAD(P)-binding protein [Penicillium cataractarum]|uniref:NAD(P)-binding protein n=1 Tax=Penicillium cataractarum TaxID=2100454 RepID=A0A9W9S546_9EURO|nr:NAD(P)-binding protein [Penicillium cataractarum]KAJ5369763.1 NAD(P)-binding protein [Penicillium cataractarum]